jgi:uncharacterized protein (TIGR00106 family)
MSVLAEVSIYPVDKGASLSDHVTRAIEVIRDSGLSFRLGPMGTTIEADSVSQVLHVIDQAFAAVQSDSQRVEAVVKLDWRAGRSGGLDEKVESVKKKLPGEIA